MKVDRACFSGAFGNAHTVFFLGHLKSVWDYPHKLDEVPLSEWREDQPTAGDIDSSHGVEAKA